MKKMLLVLAAALLGVPALAQEIPKTDTPLVFKSVVRDVNVREFVLSPEEEVRFFKSNVTRLEREVVVAVLQTRMSMETEEDGSIVALLLRVKTETACYGFCFEPEVLEPPSCVVPLEMPKATAAVPARDGGFSCKSKSRVENLDTALQEELADISRTASPSPGSHEGSPRHTAGVSSYSCDRISVDSRATAPKLDCRSCRTQTYCLSPGQSAR